MSRRLIAVLVAVVLVVAGGFMAYRYMFSSTVSYADYKAPVYEAGASDEQKIFQLQSDLGAAAAEMAQLQEMAKELQFGKMKEMGRHLQQVSDELQPRLAEIKDPGAKALLAQGIRGLRTVGEGSEELDPGKSLRGVDDVLSSFDELNKRNA